MIFGCKKYGYFFGYCCCDPERKHLPLQYLKNPIIFFSLLLKCHFKNTFWFNLLLLLLLPLLWRVVKNPMFFHWVMQYFGFQFSNVISFSTVASRCRSRQQRLLCRLQKWDPDGLRLQLIGVFYVGYVNWTQTSLCDAHRSQRLGFVRLLHKAAAAEHSVANSADYWTLPTRLKLGLKSTEC